MLDVIALIALLAALAIVAWVFVALISFPLGQVLVAIAIFVTGIAVGNVLQLVKR